MTLAFYGDNHYGFATYALWQCHYWGHPEDQLQVLHGPRQMAGGGPAAGAGRPAYPRTSYRAARPDDNVRATKAVISHTLRARGHANLGDVRSPEEFTGKVIAPPGMHETTQRVGHIPGAVNIPWARAVTEDSTLESAAELRALDAGKGVDLRQETVAYCCIGERSSHNWFGLKYLLSLPKVRNCDGPRRNGAIWSAPLSSH